MKDDVRLCDVIIAGHVTRYMEDQKCVDRPKKDGFTFKPRPDAHTRVDTATSDDIDHRISSDPKFLQQWKGECDSIALSVFGDHAKNQTLEKLGVTTASSNLRLLTKKIFSGPLLLDSSCFKSELKNLDGGCHALDMESGGFAWGWMALPIPDADKPKMVVIKGISDYGDGSKGDTDSGKSSAKPKLSKEEKEKKAAIANVGADDFRRIAMRRAWVTMISLLRAGLIT